MLTYVFSFVFPIFLVTWGMQCLLEHFVKRWTGMTAALAALAAALVCAAIPLQGISAARWLISFTANFSIPLTALVLDRIWERAFGNPLMDSRARRTAWSFGLGGGILLYPMALGLGEFDPYGLGFGSPRLLVPLLLFTLWLLHRQDRFGAILVACVLTYNLRLLESSNLWDYLLDPLYVGSALVHHAIRWTRNVRARSSSPNHT